jgi:hypothetical protein
MKADDTESRHAETTTKASHTATPRSGTSASPSKSPDIDREDADMPLFLFRNRARGRMVTRAIELAMEHQLQILDVRLRAYMDPRDIIPAARTLVKRLTKNGGAALLYVLYRNGHPYRLCGYLLANESFETIRTKFAKMIGVRPSALRVHCPKKGAKLSQLLSMLTMPALSTHPAHPPMTIVAGELQALYQDIATTLAELSAASTSSSVTTATASKRPGEGRAIDKSSGSEIESERKCLNCGKPIGKRGNRADFCERHGTKAERRLFNRRAAQAHAPRASKPSNPKQSARSADSSLASAGQTAPKTNTARSPSTRNNDVIRNRGRAKPARALSYVPVIRTRRRPR